VYLPGGTDALDYLRSLNERPGVSPGLILLDVQMPDVSGLDVLRQIRASPGTSGIPVVMMTASPDREARRGAAELGATDLWDKGTLDDGRLGRLLDRVGPPDRPRRAAQAPRNGTPQQLPRQPPQQPTT
jgi:CheY-like chemotaxis protein